MEERSQVNWGYVVFHRTKEKVPDSPSPSSLHKQRSLNGKVGLAMWNWLAQYTAFTLLAPSKTTSFPEKIWVLIAVVQTHLVDRPRYTIFSERNNRVSQKTVIKYYRRAHSDFFLFYN